MRMAPDFDKANEIYFRLGIIYKQQQKFNQSLEVCRSVLSKSRPANVLSSASNLSLVTPRGLYRKRISGFKLAMSMSSRRT